ncbi:MAG: hypothetical protein FWH01_08410 [Oscillospiraceae bacterium]|nr:hypothetical protein [Oscillospiraceae bacterium]
MSVDKSYKYHSQRQAGAFARAIIPVPGDYPLREGLPDGFRADFARLCDLARGVYMDMASQPEAYGLILLDIGETDYNLARDSYRSIHRFVDTLNALFMNGDVDRHCLTVDAARFRAAIRKTPAVPKYELVLARLCDAGFSISGFDGATLDKKAVTHTVEFPDDPHMIDTIKTYCECWGELDRFRRNRDKARVELIKVSPQQMHHHFYRFDYKITADLARIPMLTWVNEESDYLGYSDQLKKFSEAYYLESVKYDKVKFDGDYHFKGKRITRITATGFEALGTPDYKLAVKLTDPDKYMDAIAAMGNSINEKFNRDYCNHCNFQGATNDYCKFRLKWTFGGVSREGCAYQCFVFDDFDPARAPDYWRLLELEYGLK